MVRKLVRNFTRGLLLRNDIFYFRMDIKVANDRYKSIRRSLHTKDFYTAIHRVKQMNHLVRAFSELTPQEQAEFIKFYTGDSSPLTDEEKAALESGDSTSVICTALDAWLAKNMDAGELVDRFIQKSVELDVVDMDYPDTVRERLAAKRSAMRDVVDARYIMSIRKQLNPEEEQEYDEIIDMANDSKLHDKSWEEYQKRQTAKNAPRATVVSQPHPISPEPQKTQNKHTIGEIMQYMFQVSQIKSETRKSQEYDVQNMVACVGLKLEDDYSKLNDQETINKICTWVKERKKKDGTDISNKRKNKLLGILRSLITAAYRKEPAQYKLTELTSGIIFLRKESKGNMKEYWSFSNAQLSEIFDPKHDFFKKNPEQFLACLIALFSGARTNAAVSLQFRDITKEYDIDVIAFLENHDRKHLKNEASERYLPIAKQLMDWGFVDMIRERQQKIGAKDTDFIFDRTQNKLTGDPADKFMTPFLRFIREKLGIVQTGRKIYSFHSFRDTVSNKMEDCGISDSMAHKLVGWKETDIRRANYMKRDCQEWKTAIDKLEYPEDVLHLEEWKKIIPDLYINPEKINHKRGKYKPHIKID